VIVAGLGVGQACGDQELGTLESPARLGRRSGSTSMRGWPSWRDKNGLEVEVARFVRDALCVPVTMLALIVDHHHDSPQRSSSS
jgi:hypothetical protein